MTSNQEILRSMRRYDPILWLARVLAVAVLVLAVAVIRDIVTPVGGAPQPASEAHGAATAAAGAKPPTGTVGAAHARLPMFKARS